MKSYTITVNGNVYDVTVEEKGGVTPAAAPAPQAAPVMAQAPQAAPHRLQNPQEQDLFR